MRAVCERYRLTDRAEVLNVVLWWQDRTWRGIDAAADVDPAMARLRDTGVSAAIRETYEWVREHRATLTGRL
jgi:hypothetical protein